MRQWSISRDVYVEPKEAIKIREDLTALMHKNRHIDLAIALNKNNLIEYYKDNNIPEYVTEYLENKGVCMSMNAQFFDISRDCVCSTLINKLFLERKSDKKLSQKYKKDAQDLKHEIESFSGQDVSGLEEKRTDALRQSGIFDVRQLVKKILLGN